MLMPSIFGESLLDDFFKSSFVTKNNNTSGFSDRANAVNVFFRKEI